jgi:hypothetical protein
MDQCSIALYLFMKRLSVKEIYQNLGHTLRSGMFYSLQLTMVPWVGSQCDRGWACGEAESVESA